MNWMTPTWPWTLRGQMYLICILVLPPPVPNFTPFCCMTSYFPVKGHFVIKAPNDSQMTLNTIWSKAPHICSTTTGPLIPNFIPFHSTVSRFRVTGCLKELCKMATKWPWTLQGQRYSHVCPTTEVPNLNWYRSTASHFELQVILRQVHWMTPKMTLDNTMSKVPYICSTSTPYLVRLILSYLTPESKLQSILR